MEFQSFVELQSAIDENPAVLLYFSSPACQLCLGLKHKLMEMMEQLYPEIRVYVIDITRSPQISGQMLIFTTPSIIVYFERKEFLRKSRTISLKELRDSLRNPYARIT